MTTNDATNTVSKWLGLFQSTWAVVMMIVAIGTLIANQHVRLSQIEWNIDNHIKAQNDTAQKSDETLKVVSSKLDDISSRLIRMEERWNATRR